MSKIGWIVFALVIGLSMKLTKVACKLTLVEDPFTAWAIGACSVIVAFGIVRFIEWWSDN